jgi:type I restriction enzyme S subunit
MTHKPYPKYKASGVPWLGEMPDEWKTVRGRFIYRVNPASAPILRGLDPQAEVSFVPMEAVGIEGGLDLKEAKLISDVSGSYTEFQEDDIVLAKITPCFENGKAAIATGLKNGAAYGTTELHVLRTGPEISRRFLFFLIVSEKFRQFGESEMYGAGGQKRVPPSFLKDFRVPIPPLDEQNAIAKYLDSACGRIGKLIDKNGDLIEKLRTKRTALISHAVTRGLPPAVARAAGLAENPPFKSSGVAWLGEVPQHWRVNKITYCFSKIGSGTTPSSDSSDFYGGAIPWVTTSELRETLIHQTNNTVTPLALSKYSALKVYPKGSLMIAMYGATIGRLGILGVDATCNQACCVFSGPTRISSEFGYYWLWMRRPVLIALSNGGGQPNLSQGDLKSLRIPTPPPHEQAAITAYLDRECAQIDSLITKIEAAIDKLKEYRAALISAAVIGKIDVRDAAQNPSLN